MKLYNSIATFDVYVVAESSEEARATLLAWIREGSPPNEIIGVETNRSTAIRDNWHEQKPLVAADISDADFNQLAGKTTIEIFKKIYTKKLNV